MNNLHEQVLELEEIEVAHICLFEHWSGKVLIQHNRKFDKSSFVWWKCEGNSIVDTILNEMWDEIWCSLLPGTFVEVMKNTREVWGKICNGTIFAGILPEGVQLIDTKGEWESKFYELDEAPLDDFITWDTRYQVIQIIEKCYSSLHENLNSEENY